MMPPPGGMMPPFRGPPPRAGPGPNMPIGMNPIRPMHPLRPGLMAAKPDAPMSPSEGGLASLAGPPRIRPAQMAKSN
jgi:hypothetical protein